LREELRARDVGLFGLDSDEVITALVVTSDEAERNDELLVCAFVSTDAEDTDICSVVEFFDCCDMDEQQQSSSFEEPVVVFVLHVEVLVV
jgi:hypothetical protein